MMKACASADSGANHRTTKPVLNMRRSIEIKRPGSPRTVEKLAGLTDEQLLARYCNTGDRTVFSTLVRRYERELYNYLRRYLGDAEMAEDAFQATFLQVHLKCETFDPARRFRPWLYTIATNQAIDAQRRNKRHKAAVSLDRGGVDHGEQTQRIGDLLESGVDDPLDEAVRSEQGEWVREAVSRLSDNLRPVIELVYFQGMSYGDAADVLGIPVGTVKSRMHAAVAKLTATWQACGQPWLESSSIDDAND